MKQVSTPPLVLGTAQLGMVYGVANRSGAPSEREASAIIEAALAAGIRNIDTARAYGESETRLGKVLGGRTDIRIVTKLAPLDGFSETAEEADIVQAVRASIEKSKRALRRERLDILLLHRARHLKAYGGAIWNTLRSLQQEGAIDSLGVSVQTPDELKLALSFRDTKHVQMPFNVLDWRFRKRSLRARIAERSEVTIHARSALLQGLLAADDASLWPAFPGLDTPHLLRGLGALVESLGRRDLADLCFAYVRAQGFVQGIVVGVETPAQIEANTALFQRPPLTPDEVQFVERFLPRLPETLLDPALWPHKRAA